MKAVRNDYSEQPFFFSEPFEEGVRTVAWNPTTDGQKAIFFALLKRTGDRIEYLFKEDSEQELGQQWTRIFGGIYKRDLEELIQRYEDWFFSDSIFQFCVREPEEAGYFAYDEHGLFFIYDKNEDATLTELGLSNESKELLTAEPHWHVRPKEAESRLEEFKSALKDASVFFDDEAEPLNADGPGKQLR